MLWRIELEILVVDRGDTISELATKLDHTESYLSRAVADLVEKRFVHPDTSALGSLGIVSHGDPRPSEHTFHTYDVHVPAAVVTGLGDMTPWEDSHGANATRPRQRLYESWVA